MTVPDVTTAVERVSRYLAERDKMRQLDKYSIHGLHIGDVREAVLTQADLRTILSDHARLSAALGEAREALEPLARLQLPIKSVGNAGAYSILHSDIRRARTALQQQEQ